MLETKPNEKKKLYVGQWENIVYVEYILIEDQLYG